MLLNFLLTQRMFRTTNSRTLETALGFNGLYTRALRIWYTRYLLIQAKIIVEEK
jgi:hypothetical protein